MLKIDIILDTEEIFTRDSSFNGDRGDTELILHKVSAYITTQKYCDFE